MTVLRRYLATAAALAAFAAPAYTQPSGSGGSKLLAPFQPIVAKANSATVRILCDDKEAALGTIVTAEGHILTKASELAKADGLRGTLTVKLGDGSVLDTEILSIHTPTDLALIKIDMKGLNPVAFADSKNVPTGNWLAAAGIGTNPTAVGIVSVMTRDLSGMDAREILNQNRGYLGVQLATADDPKGGAIIEEFPKEGGPSAAQKGDLKTGDVIIDVAGRTVAGRDELRGLLSDYRPGEKVEVKARRSGEVMTFKITLGKAPPDRSAIQNSMGGELSGRRTGFPTVLQTDMVLDPKNIGGPIVDLDGKVLGISIARAGRVETWILPSETIRPLLTDMRAGKFPPFVGAVKKTTLPTAPAPRAKAPGRSVEKN